MSERVIRSQYFYGNKISDYGIQNGYVDYSTLAKAFDAVLNNEVITKTYNIGYWEIVNGYDYDDYANDYYEIFQYYIISDAGAALLKDWTDEIVYYNDELDMYVWGVTHYGTAWTHVLTDIKVESKSL